jgi:16S rRNA (guanine(966)-N(2))-methyltransferase RsmD
LSAQPNKGQNTVRISGGVWRSRLLRFGDAPGLRPTPDRVRQTLFNWLGQELHGKRCLDLFAGTGALGFEAASRGAMQVVMVENNAATQLDLQKNAQLLGAEQVDIQRNEALRFLAANTQRFDVVFLDPPFNQGWLEKIMPQLAASLAPDGVVYVEAEKPVADDSGWQVLKSGKAGNVRYHLLSLLK